MGQHQRPRYGQVILVSGYPVFDSCQLLSTTLMSNGYVHYQFSCAVKLARKYEIEQLL